MSDWDFIAEALADSDLPTAELACDALDRLRTLHDPAWKPATNTARCTALVRDFVSIERPCKRKRATGEYCALHSQLEE